VAYAADNVESVKIESAVKTVFAADYIKKNRRVEIND